MKGRTGYCAVCGMFQYPEQQALTACGTIVCLWDYPEHLAGCVLCQAAERQQEVDMKTERDASDGPPTQAGVEP